MQLYPRKTSCYPLHPMAAQVVNGETTQLRYPHFLSSLLFPLSSPSLDFHAIPVENIYI